MLSRKALKALLSVAAALSLLSQPSLADEGGVSFWIPGFFGSLAAAPMVPGFSLASMYYHTSVTSDSDVARAKEITIGRIPATIAGRVTASLNADADIAIAIPQYTFATPVLGGQLTLGMITSYGRNSASVDATLNAALLVGPFAFTRSRFDTIADSVTGLGDILPLASLRWNAGVHNFMIYGTGDVPVGAYQSTRLANIGIGHGAADGGLGYTYFDQKTGHEFSAVAGFTYNMLNTSTQYQNGVDFHLDWAASQFLTKQFQLGVVGYLYNQVTCDSGSGDHVGCFESRVASVGAQLGYIIPMGAVQGYVNVKAYREFESAHRPEGYNVWLTFVLSPAPPSGASPAMQTPTRPMYTK